MEQKKNKDAIRSELCVVIILKMLSKEKRYAYDIIQNMNSIFKDFLNFQRGTIYPTLYRMEADGFITSEKVVISGMRRERIYYCITNEGEKELERLSQKYLELSRLIIKVLNDEIDFSDLPNKKII